jgi:3-hydroxyacyl-CoA dehydrogenase
MATAGSALLSEGIIRDWFDVDLILVHGYGFPREDSGPLWASREWNPVALRRGA